MIKSERNCSTCKYSATIQDGERFVCKHEDRFNEWAPHNAICGFYLPKNLQDEFEDLCFDEHKITQNWDNKTTIMKWEIEEAFRTGFKTRKRTIKEKIK
jgi:hypothetical protein